MRKSTYRGFVIVAAMAVFFGMVACSDEPREKAEEAVDADAANEALGEPAEAEGGDDAPEPESRGEEEASGEDERAGGDDEHAEGGEDSEHGSEGEEESGEQLGLEDTWDATRSGARLVLSFDPSSNAFVGTVENTTQQTLCAVRVEVHLSTGTELGPTERTDLPSGKTTVVQLPTAGEVFEGWTAHPEVSPCTSV